MEELSRRFRVLPNALPWEHRLIHVQSLSRPLPIFFAQQRAPVRGAVQASAFAFALFRRETLARPLFHLTSPSTRMIRYASFRSKDNFEAGIINACLRICHSSLP